MCVEPLGNYWTEKRYGATFLKKKILCAKSHSDGKFDHSRETDELGFLKYNKSNLKFVFLFVCFYMYQMLHQNILH